MSNIGNSLTEGNVGKQLIKFSMPFLLSNILQSIYGLADFLIVTRYSGIVSSAGVNTGSQLTMLVTNVIIGITTGGTVLISQYLGAKREKDVKQTVGTLLSVMIILSILVTILMLVIGEPFAKVLGTRQSDMNETMSYYNICIMGSIFVFGYNVISAILRGMGDSKNPLIFVGIACVVNIVLDMIFVKGYDMGSAGAAYATVIAQAVSLVFAIVYLMKKDFVFDFKLSSFKIDLTKMKMIFTIGLPTAIQNSMTSISFLVLLRIVNIFGTNANAASGCVNKINGFAILPGIAMMMSIAAMSGQNIGAGENERAIKTLKIGVSISAIIGVIIFIFIQSMPEFVLSIFGMEDEAVELGVSYLRGFSIDYLIVPTAFCLNGLITGSGHTLYVAIVSITSALFIRVPVAYFLSIVCDLGMFGTGIAVPISSVVMITCSFIFIKRGKWKICVVDKNKACV